MKYIVKGHPMASGERSTTEETGNSRRCSLGVFGSAGLLDDSECGGAVAFDERVPFPPHTVILLTDRPA